MTSKSSPLAFLPSPTTTLPAGGNENFPPLSPTQTTLVETLTSPLTRSSISAHTGLRRTPSDILSSNGHLSHFVSPNYNSTAKSISSAVSRPSLSSQPFTSPSLSATLSNVTPASFIDQSRALLERQRHLFEQERSLFSQEREMWETERQALYERIRELETALGGNNGSGRKVSESTIGRPSVDSVSTFGQLNYRGTFGNAGSSGSIRLQPGQNDTGDKFWEGSSSHKNSATRTFSPPQKSEEGHLPSISENGSISPNRVIERPGLRGRKDSESGVRFVEPTSNIVGNGIDISLIEKDLDGISLKASSLHPAVLAKVRSPPPPESPGVSPSSGHNSSGISPGGLFNLKKDAGHTPPTLERFSLEDSEQATPKQPEHLHRPSIAYPLPDGLSSDSPLEEDPALAAPLGITNNGEKDAAFLNQLNSKLLQEAHKIFPETPSSSDGENASIDMHHQAESEVQIRFKRSMNFGRPFGSTGFSSE
ncbi:hypothetical protein FGG08_005787 [Glutinoglossum americanum]|uniref:Uncharacterized protein n=1 Tax=Glutinoglossum americanum TaxID=1670608 RepID=A0A9P8HXI9_9PEZI|nr:hypothetical protein FGG08_005787 [Glutinoglossum americanum]